MPLSDDEQTELLQLARDIKAMLQDGLVVNLTDDAAAAVAAAAEQAVTPKLQPAVRNAMFTLQMNVPVPAGVATFSPRQRDGST